MKQVLFCCIVLIILGSCNQKETSTIDDGWISLLNDDLSGWNQAGALEAEITDDILSLTATGDQQTGMITTQDNHYDNFHLILEFKSPDIQAGILFRFNDQLKTEPQKGGYLINLDFNPDQQNPTGSIVNIARATVPENINTEDWNALEVKAAGSHLQIFLNNVLVAEGNDQGFRSGRIGLQAPAQAYTTVQFRNIRIMPLVTTTVITELLEDRYRSDTLRSWESIFDGSTLHGWAHVGDGSWDVEDGVIHGYSGAEGGFLVNENVYKNFYLLSKFKILKEDNSGIWVRKSPDSANVSITDAIECNIYDHNGPSHVYSTGSIATHARAWYGMIDYEDWNEMEIFAENEHIVMYVNGNKSSESYLPSNFNKAGNICLQGGIKVFAEDKGPSDIYFKEIMVKSMD